jgi:hypothetical protein
VRHGRETRYAGCCGHVARRIDGASLHESRVTEIHDVTYLIFRPDPGNVLELK